MRGLETRLPDFKRRGVQIAAISADSTEESRKLRKDQGYTFLFLSDPPADAIRSYGVLHAGAGESGKDIARPAEFLVDASGTIRWVNLTESLRVRARSGTILDEIDRLQPPLGTSRNRSSAILALRSFRRLSR